MEFGQNVLTRTRKISRLRFDPTEPLSGVTIEAVSPPSLGTARAGATLNSIFSAGVYSASGTAISSQVVTFVVGGTSRAGTYVLTSGDVGAALVAVETVTAGEETKAFTVTSTVQAALGPVNTVAPVISVAQAIPGQVVTATAGTWDVAGDTTTYQWYRGAALITGADASTYTLTTADSLLGIRCAVTRTADGEPTTAFSNTITLSAPAKPAVLTSPTVIGSTSFSAVLPSDPSGPGTITNRVVRATPTADLANNDFTNSIFVALLGAGATATVPGATASTEYKVQWRANNQNGSSEYSDPVTVTTSATSTNTVPSAFSASQWSLTDSPSSGGDKLKITINSLPANGGVAISGIQWTRDGGTTWNSLTLLPAVTGDYTITVPATTAATIALRAVNSVGNGTASATKAATPTVATTTGSITLTATSRDRLLFDSGGARKLDEGSIPTTGTGPNGAVIEGRLVSLGDNGASSTAWADVGTVSAGIYTGALKGPRNSRWYKRVVRIKGNAASEVESAFDRRVGVGHVIAIWGQSEWARGWSTTHSLMTAETLKTSALDRLEALRTNLKLNGCQIARASLKVPGVDAAPSGVTFNTTAKTITVAANATVVFDGWNLFNWTSAGQWPASSAVTFKNCRIGRGADVDQVQFVIDSYGLLALEWCDLEGSFKGYGTGFSGQMILQRTDSNKISYRYCRFFGHGTDPVKFNYGEMVGCYLEPAVTVDRDPVIWNSGTTYVAGAIVVKSDTKSAHMWRAKRQNSNSALPGSNNSTADTLDWAYINPHVDQGTIRKTAGECVIRDTYINQDHETRFYPVNGRLANGFNNAWRFGGSPDSLMGHQITVENCLMTYADDLVSVPIQITNQDAAGYVPPIFRHCYFKTNSAGKVFYNTAPLTENDIIWEGNRNLAGAALTMPSGATAGTTTPNFQPELGEMFQIMYHDRSVSGVAGVVHKHLSATDSHTAAMAAAANAGHIGRPGDKFALIEHTVSGSSIVDVADNTTNPRRSMVQEQALHDYATDNGSTPVGLAGFAWWNSAAGYTDDYDKAFIGFLFGIDRDTGATLSRTVATVINASRSVTYNNNLSDLYDWTKTRALFFGPFRFDIGAVDETNAASNARNLQIQKCRISARNIPGNTRIPAGSVLPMGLEIIDYQNGQPTATDAPDGSNNYSASGTFFQDMIHPFRYGDDGQNRLWRYGMQAMIQGMGLHSWKVPVIDTAEWHSAGDYVDFSCSFCDFDTLRRMRGIAPASTVGFAHRQPVADVEINGTPCLKNDIVNGKLRVWYGDGTQSFINTDRITFGPGGGTGMLIYPEDFKADYYLNVLVGKVPVPGLGTASVRPMPAASVMANPLTKTTRTTVSGGGGTTPTAPSAFTDAMFSVVATDGGATVTIASLPSNGGSAITALQYQLNGDAWTDSGRTTAGTFALTGLTNDTTRTIIMRAVNAYGNGAANTNAKSFTPQAASGGDTFITSDVSGSAGPYFVDPAGVGANTGKLTFEFVGTIPSPAAAVTLAALSASMFRLEAVAGATGTIRATVRDSANASTLISAGTITTGTLSGSSVVGGSFTWGTEITVLSTVDLASNAFKVWLGGVKIIDVTLAANSGAWTTTRLLSALALNTGVGQLGGTIKSIKFWKEAITTAVAPTGTPYKTIIGPAATANADAWKQGADAT
jgi:hypothetical protein